MTKTGPTIQMAHDHGGAPGGGSSWPTWLKVGGIGCGVLVLIGALLLALGFFRVVTCCADHEDYRQSAEASEIEGHQVAHALHGGDYQFVYEALDESTRQSVTVDEIEEYFEEFRPYLDASEPFPVQRLREAHEFEWGELGDQEEIEVVTHFAEPRYEERLELRLTFATDVVDDERVDTRLVDWEAELETRDFEESDYVRIAQRFHDRVERGDFESARRVFWGGQQDLADREELDEVPRMTTEDFRDELAPFSDEFSSMTRSEPYGLYPHEFVDTITVRMLLVDKEGQSHFVDYVVNWQGAVHEVSEIRPADVEVETDDTESDDEQSDEEGVDDQEESDGADDAGDSEESGVEEGQD